MNRRKIIKYTGLGVVAMGGLGHVPLNVLAARSGKQRGGRKIHLFSKHLHWVGYEEMAKITAAIGFDGLDLTVRPKGHVEPENVERDLPMAVEAADKYGITIEMMTTAIKSADDPLTEPILKTAAGLGIKYYRLNWFSYDYSISIPENIKRFAVELKKIDALNAKYGIIGDYQNHAGTSLGSPVWDIYQMLEVAGTTSVGVQYDIRHAMVEGMNSWSLGLRLLAPYINTIDIKDFEWLKDGDRWIVKNVPLGHGAVDFHSYFALLNELGVDAPISIHFEYPIGGAENGDFEITIPRSQVMDAMTRDLSFLKTII